MKHVIRLLISFYRHVIRRPLHILCGPGSGCRFTPSCSEYFLQAVNAHGAWKGSALGIRRSLKCNPWGPMGYDPVPPAKTPKP